jgi:hypothetical protein
MDKISQLEGKEELKTWIEQKTQQAIEELMDRKIVDVLLAEAKPAWILPFSILIGKVRERGQASGHIWFICGEKIPTDHVHSSKASSPREAARHFALKWQLDAAREQEAYEKSGGKWMPGARSAHGKDELIKQAEGLYELAATEYLWEA